MRVACLQFCPKLCEVKENIRLADSLLAGVLRSQLDLLVLPELALTDHSLEIQGAGPSSQWAQATAQRLNCIVSIGYPEKAITPSPTTVSRTPTGSDRRYNYNSTIVYGPSGDCLAHYRKHFLLPADTKWASEPVNHFGELEKFSTHYIREPLDTQVALGICMDLNPYQGTAPWTDFEFANHVVYSGAKLVILSMAWYSDLPKEDYEEGNVHEPDLKVFAYWVERLRPLLDANQEVVIVLANRCGSEADIRYVGTSTVLKIGKGSVRAWNLLGRGEQKCLVVDTGTDPEYIWDWRRKLFSDCPETGAESGVEREGMEAVFVEQVA
ncbi:putative carbon-nitrogen hydrolase protein [Botrytis fragariae]|uniref:Putative carbon-nitrogen hydrolase protein n=1 Tax=Botrytis fragariae TaxID=1964551 RepID=A0A8H6ASW0_9HELO|nr:putative carbon-nitrogen hydrolase protein [Botrytis fragariae]KAF5873176.1 putative carbon-nitrogen hydrolase protein [Botrytis fragariae]